jgi:hypothetical protein
MQDYLKLLFASDELFRRKRVLIKEIIGEYDSYGMAD